MTFLRWFRNAVLVLVATSASFHGAFVAAARAQDGAPPEALAAAREFATLTPDTAIRSMVSALTTNVWPAMEAAVRLSNPTVDPQTIGMLRSEYEHLAGDAVRKMMVDSAPVYAKYFSAGELREMVAFYRTPAGAKALALMPAASLEILGGFAPGMEALSASLDTRFAEILKQRGYKP